MDVNFDTNQAVIVAFIFTVVAVSVATMFLSCFGKKKDKKKGNKKGKSKSPSPQPVPRPSPVETARIEQPAVEDKPRPEVNVDAVEAEVDDLGDFSAVQRETEILRSEINDESTLQLSFTSNQDATDKTESEPEPEPEVKPAVSNEEIVASPSPDKRNSTPAASSMLDDIELTLANLSTDTKKEVTEVSSGVLATIKDTEKKVISVEKNAVNDVVIEKRVVETEITKKEASVGLNIAPVAVHSAEKTANKEIKERVVPSVSVQSVSAELKETKEEVERKTVSSVTEVKEEVESETASTVNTELSKLEDVKVEIENKPSTLVSSAVTDTSEREEKVKEPEDGNHSKSDSLFDKVGASALVEEVKETVKDKFERSVGDTKEDVDQKEKEEKKHEETKVNGTLNALEKASSLLQDFGPSPKTSSSPKAEVKIPPKVSPKPSPKMIPRTLLTKSEAIQDSNSQDTGKEDLSSPVEAPASPTSPLSPTQAKAQSRIPMSKKTSGIPKFSFGSSKSSSILPLSSPDASMAKKGDQITTNYQKEGEQIIEEVKDVEDNLQHNIQELHARDSKEKSPEPDKNNSPFERENRGSKSRLTKLRYSGRKSADSKSDESGSERGSRAGSEAKSEDGKKAPEDPSDLDKSSRIPVRAGSKPRSSPPKALGD